MEFQVMERARIWNDSDRDYEEDYNGVRIKVPARKYTEMEYKEGVAFKSQFVALIKNSATGKEVQNKPLRLERFVVKVPKSELRASAGLNEVYRCMACKGSPDFTTELEYEAHASERHGHQIVREKEAKEGLEKARARA